MKAPQQTEAVDPCPECGAEVDGTSVDFHYERSNPEAVITISDPSCPHENDPAADCTCTAFVNPSPNPAFDKHIPIAGMNTWTLHPCGHVFKQYELAAHKWGSWAIDPTTGERQRIAFG